MVSTSFKSIPRRIETICWKENGTHKPNIDGWWRGKKILHSKPQFTTTLEYLNLLHAVVKMLLQEWSHFPKHEALILARGLLEKNWFPLKLYACIKSHTRNILQFPRTGTILLLIGGNSRQHLLKFLWLAYNMQYPEQYKALLFFCLSGHCFEFV